MPYKNKEDREKWRKEYYQKNKEKILENHKKYYKNNRREAIKRSKRWAKNNFEKVKEYNKKHFKKYWEKIKERSKRWRKENPERFKKAKKEWAKNNLEKVREVYRKRQSNNYKTDLKFNLNDKMRTAIRISLKGNKKGRRWEILVSYTLNDLIKHLKKTMPKDYNWKDYLQGKLHIDHIIPISAFNFNKPEHIDFKRCWALSNLRLLPAKENKNKSNKLIRPFQLTLKI